jgi:hypothetical protein
VLAAPVRKLFAVSLLCAIQAQPMAAELLLGVDFDTGNRYSISETAAARTLIGNTGVANWADIQVALNRTLYGVTHWHRTAVVCDQPNDRCRAPCGPRIRI